MARMIRLLNDQVLLRHIPVPESDIIITPDEWQTEIGRTTLRGKVVSAGPKAVNVKAGDLVAFYGLQELTWPHKVGSVDTRDHFGKDEVIVREKHIQAVIG